MHARAPTDDPRVDHHLHLCVYYTLALFLKQLSAAPRTINVLCSPVYDVVWCHARERWCHVL